MAEQRTKEKRLYLVKLAGLPQCYAIAKDPTAAYKKVRKWLDDNEHGFTKDRAMESVHLLADVDQYADAPARLYS